MLTSTPTSRQSELYVRPGRHIRPNTSSAARIRNPLAGAPRDELMNRVQLFAEEKGLIEHLPCVRHLQAKGTYFS